MTVIDAALDEEIIGDSPAIRELRAMIRRVAPLDLPVLIEGPTGAGKELVAQGLHSVSGRRGRCVALNVCAVPESMFEDTLFGHVRGAFTGATADTRGYLAEADGGTLFLDEIGGLALPLQAKLLRVIETGRFRPVGGGTDRASSFRVVCATNQPLHTLVGDGQFRSDLAHRLSGVVLPVPPLRARREDIPHLVRHFANDARDGTRRYEFTDAAMRTLRNHDWPGNVRELRNVVERAAALSDRLTLGREAVLRALRPAARRAGTSRPQSFERRRLESVLEKCDWDTACAAEQLGVHRSTVYRRMKRFGIDPSGPGAQPASERDAAGMRHRSHQ